jgi:hypothetical protein
MKFSLYARLTAEFVGTAFLLMAVVGSGIMGEKLSGGNVAITLLANTLATGAALVALILTFGPISGAHFNPAVTLADATQHGIAWNEVPGYLAAQVVGAYFGVICAHLMFGLPSFSASQQSQRHLADLQRIRRHLRLTLRNLGMFAASFVCSSLCGGRIHYRRILVHSINIFRQSSCHSRASGEQHLQRNSPYGCSRVPSCSVAGCSSRNRPFPLAHTGSARGCGQYCCST